IELLHSAIPYPLFLVTGLPSDAERGPVIVSLAHLRRSLNEAGAVVVEAVEQVTLAWGEPLSGVERTFLASLDLRALPRGDMCVFYQSWVERLTALRAAEVTGAFTIPPTPAAAAE